jgi:hypothetical protein
VQDSLYYGTLEALTPGAPPPVVADPHALSVDGMERRLSVVPVAASIRDATVIALIRFEHELSATSSVHLRLYKVQATPLHIGPVAVVEELRQRLGAIGWRGDGLVQEYWSPSGIWHLREILVSSLVVVEEVAPASDREVYVARWVLYREDAERARLL